ncbi:MAG: transporter permease [Rhodospirillales bacterium]|jgi:NitT/TauT family transport system permease protein|nr:transporter permease [Rhodospirillales bacterium]
MNTVAETIDHDDAASARTRKVIIRGGQVALAVALIWIWKIGADTAGELFVADPFKVAARLWDIAKSGVLWMHTYETLRISAIGFVIGCFFGVLLPFVLRRMPRLTDAIEPYIMASVGVPKYALIPLFILWFGIKDAPKLWLIGLLVFYPVFIAIFAGIRGVDGRLINMARVVGASETRISREVIWNALLPFFFSGLKIALPRAVSAAIIGEFLVGNKGIGFYIENSRQQMDVTGAFTGIIVATALVLIVNAALVYIDKRVNAWRPTDRHMAV